MNSPVPRILVVDDESPMRQILERALLQEGFNVSSATGGLSALQIIQKDHFDLIILDLSLPDLSGEEVCREIRRTPFVQSVPILMVTGRGAEGVPARCLNSGADDYLAKPFDLPELLAHVRALLRRSRVYVSGDAVIQNGRVAMNVGERRVFWDGRPIRDLAPKEFELLRQLILHAPNVLDKSTLALKVWGAPLEQLHERTLDVHVQRIRKKLGTAAAPCLKTVPAIGYQWRDKP